jgi:hypothetical protein
MDTSNVMKKSSVGPVIGLVVILAIIVLGSLYFWGKRANDVPSNGMYGTADAQTKSLQAQDSSDEVASIESDLNATSFTDIDSGADQMQ